MSAPGPPTGPPSTYVGTIGISSTHVYLPSGAYPIRGATWHVENRTVVVRRTSQTGLVLAGVLFFLLCVFSLFFLLMKEDRLEGKIMVTVSGDGFRHSTLVPVSGPATVTMVAQLVDYARGLSAA